MVRVAVSRRSPRDDERSHFFLIRNVSTFFSFD